MRRVTAGCSAHSHHVKWDKYSVHTDEGEKEVELAEPFIHHLAEHFREPEVGSGKHPEYSRDPHNQVEVAHDKVCVVQRKINRSLSEKQPRYAARYEQRYESEREQHRRSK